MNIKQYEEEVKQGCEIGFSFSNKKNDFGHCGQDYGKLYLCKTCQAKLEVIQKCKEMFKEREENLKQLIKSDILLFEQVSKCLDCEGCKKIIKLRIEELLSQLNGEEQ